VTLPDLPTMIKTVTRGIMRPGLLLKLNAATTAGTKIFKHYMAYPGRWDPVLFEAWKSKADGLFASAVK